MTLLSVANLHYSIGDRVLLDGVNLTLTEGEHVGLVGRNGCGKSTLLKMIAAVDGLQPDRGQIQIIRGATVGYLTQDPELDPQLTLRQEALRALEHLHELHRQIEQVSHDMAATGIEPDAMQRLLDRYQDLEHRITAAGGYAVEHQVEATLHGVGLTDEFFDVPVSGLSGGQKGRLALAKLLLAHPDVLLMDEPTNHLDIAGRQWLEEYLSEYRGAVVLVSHDRWLLDRVVSQIYELHDGKMENYPGNYQKYRELRLERRLAQQRVFDKQQEKIRHEQAFIDRYRAGQRAKQAQGREKRLERFVRDQLIDRPVEFDDIALRLRPSQRAGDLVATADHVSKGYENKPLFKDLTLVVKRGDRLGIIGPNGAGKSTLVNCLLGLVEPDAGEVRLGAAVSLGHYRQNQEHLDLSLTVVEHLRQFVMGGTGGVGSEQAARDLAGAFLFSGQDQDKPLGVLSGGERSRAVLAGLVVGGHNVLVLDEPSNHLDIASAERLEAALRQYTEPAGGYGEQVGPGTLILITHDRMLLENLVDQLLILDGAGNVRSFRGTYSEWVAAEQGSAVAAARPKKDRDSGEDGGGARGKESHQHGSRRAAGSAAHEPKSGKGGHFAKSETGAKSAKSGGKSSLSKLSQQALEQRIVELEAKVAAIDMELADPDLYRDGTKVRTLRHERARWAAELAPLEQEWVGRAEA